MVNYADYIGIPYEHGGRDDALDCYGFVKKILWDDQKVEIPSLDYESAVTEMASAVAVSLSTYKWKKINKEVGAVVLFKVRGMASHVGYYIGNDRFMHSWKPTGGVTIERLSYWEKRVLGYYKYVK